MRSDAHLDSDWNMSPGRSPPRHPASGGSSNVSSSRIMSPVLSPYHTLSPPPLCSQFPIIHLTMRRWRQGDIFQDILHHQYSLTRQKSKCFDWILSIPLTSWWMLFVCGSFTASQPQLTSWVELLQSPVWTVVNGDGERQGRQEQPKLVRHRVSASSV